MEKKRIVLLGDSIRLYGYGKLVPELLGEGFDVWQPEDNGRFVSYVLRQLFDYADKIAEADAVHFNSGEWDICELFGDGPFTPEDTYVSQIMRIVEILKQRGKKVIFATTTPVRPENPYNHNPVIERYNALVVPRLIEAGVTVNDLHAVVARDLYVNVCDDTIHLSEQGARLCAESTADAIRKACGE
ncbi:MAG: SGNH/GDSL hydrolase family protein [Clostridia bacterium]|nr:SGNH/GDSL hydrolase family protein [Clostridia bacterium]